METEHLPKLDAELEITERVDEGVEGGVEVPDPRDGRHEAGIDARLAEGDDHEANEVGEEADREDAHDDAQLTRCLDLLRQR